MDKTSKALSVGDFLRKHLSAAILMLSTFTLLMIFTVVVFWYVLTSALENYLTQQTEVLGSSLATQAAFNATQSILNNDLLSLNVLLTRLVVDENILSAQVFNRQDELLAEASSNNASNRNSDTEIRPNEAQQVYSSSVKFRNEIVGHVLITLDRTASQNTLSQINNLLISIAILICALASVLVFFMSRWLFSPINQVSEALEALSYRHTDANLPEAYYVEAATLASATEALQRMDWETPSIPESEISVSEPEIPQYEIDFDQLFAEQQKRSCALFFEIRNLDAWHQQMPPLQVANLLTPIYRALFHASEEFCGQVHQYHGHSAIIFYRAQECDENLYTNAVCSAEGFLAVIKPLLNSQLYADTPPIEFHFSLHQGNSDVLELMHNNAFDPDKITSLIKEMSLLSQTKSTNGLLLSEEVFILPDIQNRVFTGLPEIIEDNEIELMAYSVKGISDKLTRKIQAQIIDVLDIPEIIESTPVDEGKDKIESLSASRL